MSAQDERLWSILAYVSVMVAPIGALVIWLVVVVEVAGGLKALRRHHLYQAEAPVGLV